MLIEAKVFCDELLDRGYRFFSGVPCSYLGGPIALLTDEHGCYVPAANEGCASAMAAGARLVGTRSAVLMQNSGLGNAVNPITSLLQPFGIPVPAFVSLRGWPDPALDEPQHTVMGRSTRGILEACGVPHWVLDPDRESLTGVLDRVAEAEAESRPSCVLVPKGAIGPASAEGGVTSGTWTRRDALDAIVPHLGSALVFSTTGFISRELFALADRPTTFYMQGSMGHVLSLALGAALRTPDRQVMAIDGDGAALMHLGGIAAVAAQRPANLLHIIIDNGVYESTGAQATVSSHLDWAGIAKAQGSRVRVCATAGEFDAALADTKVQPGPHCLVARVSPAPGSTPPRVTSELSPFQLRERFEREMRLRPLVGTPETEEGRE